MNSRLYQLILIGLSQTQAVKGTVMPNNNVFGCVAMKMAVSSDDLLWWLLSSCLVFRLIEPEITIHHQLWVHPTTKEVDRFLQCR